MDNLNFDYWISCRWGSPSNGKNPSQSFVFSPLFLLLLLFIFFSFHHPLSPRKMVLEWLEERRKIARAWTCLQTGDEVGLGECVTWDGVSPNVTNEEGLSLLHCACHMGNAGLVHCLAEVNGVNLDQQVPGSLWTPLHFAISSKSLDCSAILLTRGANPNLTNESGQTCLHLALLSESEKLSALLLRNRADPHVLLGRRTPLYFAVRNNMEVVVALLLSNYHTQPQLPDGHGWTPLHWAARNGNTAIVSLLLSTNQPQTPNLRGSSSSVRRSVERPREFTVDINALSCNGFSPLHQAVKSGNLEVVQMLCEGGARLEVEGRRGVTPLSMAVRESKKNIVQELLQQGADPNKLSGDHKMSPLHWVEDPDICEVLLSFGASIFLKNNLGQTPLDRAIVDGKVEVAKFLVKVGGGGKGGKKESRNEGDRFSLEGGPTLQKISIPLPLEKQEGGHSGSPPISSGNSLSDTPRGSFSRSRVRSYCPLTSHSPSGPCPSSSSSPPPPPSSPSSSPSPLLSTSPSFSTPPHSPFSLIPRSPVTPSLVFRSIHFSSSPIHDSDYRPPSLRSLTDLRLLTEEEDLPTSPFDRVCFFLSLTWNNFTSSFEHHFASPPPPPPSQEIQQQNESIGDFFQRTFDEFLSLFPSPPSPPRSPLSPPRSPLCRRRSLSSTNVKEENTSIYFFPPCD